MKSPPNWLIDLPRDRLMAEISLWSADLLAIGKDIEHIDPYTDLYHLDVADGHFSPALLIFPDLVAAIRERTKRPLHVHLMVSDAILLDQIDQFAEAGADLISIHAENQLLDEGLTRIEQLGLAAGVVLQLETPVSAIERFADRVALITLLGTRIGVKGQGLDPSAEERLSAAREWLATAGLSDVIIAADGGIREHTVPGLVAAGAQTVVMGSLAFGAEDLVARMAWLRGHRTLQISSR